MTELETIVKDEILKEYFGVDVLSISKNDNIILLRFFGDDKHRDLEIDISNNELVGSGSYVDTRTMNEAKNILLNK